MRTYTGTLLMACLAVGCGSSEKQAHSPPSSCPPGQVYNGQYCAPSSPETPPPPPSNSPPPPNPSSLPPLANPGPEATQVDAQAAGVVTQLIDPLARQHVPAGAKPVGTALAGDFKTGQSLSRDVQLQPGKCYTVVGAGAPTVQNLDIQLLPAAAAGMALPVVAQDQSVASSAVLGQQPNCFHWAAPLSAPMRVVMTVSAGNGLAAAQLYEK